MSVFDILTMIGGLALFLYGMEVMGNGLSKASGGRMERILEKMTDNIFKAVLLGAGVTAVIQSSSATTVMVVGFVNSGIMKLSQAVGVIMGANIGTTVTSWLLSLTGIQGDNFILTLMKPSSFSPILAVIGVGFLMFSKNEKKKDIGTIMIGFTVLMFGMETMSDAVKPLADVREFANILLMFKNPLLGMLAGLVLGIFLCHFVVDTAQVDAVMFYPDIPAYAFGLAALLTIVFTVLVNGLLYFKLRRIDMAGSMKAIE